MAGYLPILAHKDHLHRVSTVSTYDTNSPNSNDSPAAEQSGNPDRTQTHTKLVFTDPVAFEYLAQDESTAVISRRQVLEGYELFIVEQWAVSRQHPTFTICTNTPDPSKKVFADILEVPISTEKRSSKLQVYLDAMSQSHAVEKHISIRDMQVVLMVTNLSTFPAALNVIPVTTGDIRKQTKDFVVNEDLKRMGCMGRAAMSLNYPQPSTITRFHNVFCTSVQIPLYASVTGVVRFVQQALYLYGKLDISYADGLLCDKTESGITDWWSEIGADFFNVEPSDDTVFGPTSVAALIGLLVGAYNRLRELSAPLKDPMNIADMKRAVSHFQKTNKMNRTRRLDRATLDRLHRLTASKADDEGMAVTRALKSTVAGLGGKGGEMIARGFGAKEKAGIAEVESLDISKVAELVIGPGLRWLWQGKNKGSSSAPVEDFSGRVFSVDDQGAFIWSSKKDTSADSDLVHAVDPEDKERRTGKVREAVGLTRHHHTQSQSSHGMARRDGSDPSVHAPSSARISHKTSKETFPAFETALNEQPTTNTDPDTANELETNRQPARERSDTSRSHRHALRGADHQNKDSPSKRKAQAEISSIREELTQRKYQDFESSIRYEQPTAKGLRKSISAIQLRGIGEGRASRLPRHLSFSLVSDAIESTREYETTVEEDTVEQSLSLEMRSNIVKAKLQQARSLAAKVVVIERALVPFAQSRVEKVEHVENDGQARLEELNNQYYQHLEEYQAMQATSSDLIAREKTSLTEALRSVEQLGQKLDYELDSLASRMQEVEEYVDDFEHRVIEIEASVKTLISQEEKDQRPPWYERWWPRTKSEAPVSIDGPK